MYEVRYAGFT